LTAINENKSPGAKDAAKRFLKATLGAGPALKDEIEEAAEAEKIADRTLRRAKEELKVYAFARDGQWYWTLPEPEQA